MNSYSSSWTTEEKIKDHLKMVCETIFHAIAVPNLKFDCYLAGGSIASCFQKTVPSDYDFYFRNKESFHLVKKFIENNKHIDVIAKTKNAITVWIIGTNNYHYKVQFICKLTGEPQQVIDGFDFYHCMNYYDPSNDHLFIANLDCIKNKKLLYNRAKANPYGAAWRYTKFKARGYTIDQKSLDELLLAVLNLKGIKTLIAINEFY